MSRLAATFEIAEIRFLTILLWRNYVFLFPAINDKNGHAQTGKKLSSLLYSPFLPSGDNRKPFTLCL